uniref:Uncharacterized protein n=1 Tax=Glossina pallidipes TaxID=7398 RepID=A0A1B0ADH9_GLOPL
MLNALVFVLLTRNILPMAPLILPLIKVVEYVMLCINEAGIADVQPLPVKLCGGGASVSRGDDGGGGCWCRCLAAWLAGWLSVGSFVDEIMTFSVFASNVKVMLAVAVHAFVLLDSPFYHSCPHYHLFSNCNLLLMVWRLPSLL